MEEEKKVIGRRLFSETDATLDDEGYWKILTAIGESRSFDGEEWETLYIDSMSIDNDFDRGYQTTLVSALSEYAEKTIKRGFNSIFDADKFDKAIKTKRTKKELNETKDKDNETSET